MKQRTGHLLRQCGQTEIHQEWLVEWAEELWRQGRL